MIEFGGEVEVLGPYGGQPLLVRVASVLAFAASLVMLILVPVSLGVAVIGGVGTPAASRAAFFGPFVIIGGMLAIGVWMNCTWIGWLSGGRVGAAGRCVLLLMASVLSAGVATGAVLLHVFPLVFLCVAAFVPIGILTSWLLVKISRVVDGTSAARAPRRLRSPRFVVARRTGAPLTSPSPSSSPAAGEAKRSSSRRSRADRSIPLRR